jgi:hypothetical protein
VVGVSLWRRAIPSVAWGIFKFSIYYVGLLFTAAAADVLFDLQPSGVNLYVVATSFLMN